MSEAIREDGTIDENHGKVRLAKYGITDELNKVGVFGNPDDAMMRTTVQHFALWPNGDIDINYIGLDGEPVWYNQGKKGQWKIYANKRYANPEKSKYQLPGGQDTIPYLTPKVREAYAKRTKIDRLFIVEGEFKAFMLNMQGFYAIAIPGIGSFRNKSNNRVSEWIETVIRDCKVLKVHILFDADAFDIRFDRKDHNKELSRRPLNFYLAVSKLKAKLIGYKTIKELHFGWVKKNIPVGEDEESPKGIDDLYVCKPKDVHEAISKELEEYPAKGKYIESIDLHSTPPKALQKMWGLDDVENFYNLHSTTLLEHLFTWKGGLYKYDYSESKVQLRQDVATKTYLFVGTQLFKRVYKHDPANPDGDDTILKPWTKEHFKLEVPTWKQTLYQLPRYDTFCLQPPLKEDDYEYKDVINEKSYNLYHPYPILPSPGEWPTIENMLRHVFENEYQQMYELALDYFAIAFQYPTQYLPILCMVSSERNTGKTKIIELIKSLWGQNGAILGNEAITEKYNTAWANKSFVMIDEGFIEKKAVIERIKKDSTSNTIMVRGMGKDYEEMPFIGKFVLSSNNEDNFLFIDKEEDRFWVVKVPVLKQRDPNIMSMVRDELPAFMEAMMTRQITHPKKERMWFERHLYRTKAMERVAHTSGTWTERNLKGILEEIFFAAVEEELCYQLKDIEELLAQSEGSKRYEMWEVKQILQSKWKLRPTNSRSYTKISLSKKKNELDQYVSRDQSKGRYYTIKPSFVMDPDTLKDYELLLEEKSPKMDEEAAIREDEKVKSDLDF